MQTSLGEKQTANGGEFRPPFALEELPDRLKILLVNYAVGGSTELT